MADSDRVAILLDGEYVKKVLGKTLKRFPTPDDIMVEVNRILQDHNLDGAKLYRIFYYTADPLSGIANHPLDGSSINFTTHTCLL